jgi:hypothetical protein
MPASLVRRAAAAGEPILQEQRQRLASVALKGSSKWDVGDIRLGESELEGLIFISVGEHVALDVQEDGRLLLVEALEVGVRA